VDDSAVIRRVISQALEEEPEIEVVGTAQNGLIALQRIAQTNPDVLTLDVEMPEMDGIETLRRIRRSHPQIKVIMFSTLTERGASTTMEALSLGASDYVTKASNTGNLEKSVQALRNELIPKIKQFFQPPAGVARPLGVAARTVPKPPAAKQVAPEVLVIGVSTGGPTALNEIIPMLPADFPLPVLIVQHMPPIFTKLLADRLGSRSRIRVQEATNGVAVEAGRILIAPGDFHMKVSGQPGRARIVLDQAAPENSCRPAVDPLFRSVGEVWGPSTIGVVLTGMGQDGLLGAEALRAKGAFLIAQDEASSVVWGMPGFVARAGLADKVLPLRSIIPEILGRCSTGMRSPQAS
jgi:two-component system, chemotaxis family, protein-glutamate methylesterase/glutaminase